MNSSGIEVQTAVMIDQENGRTRTRAPTEDHIECNVVFKLPSHLLEPFKRSSLFS